MGLFWVNIETIKLNWACPSSSSNSSAADDVPESFPGFVFPQLSVGFLWVVMTLLADFVAILARCLSLYLSLSICSLISVSVAIEYVACVVILVVLVAGVSLFSCVRFLINFWRKNTFDICDFHKCLSLSLLPLSFSLFLSLFISLTFVIVCINSVFCLSFCIYCEFKLL